MRILADPCRELHERLLLRNEQTKQVQLPDVYIQNEITQKNVATWMNAQYIHEAAPLILPVSGLLCLTVINDELLTWPGPGSPSHRQV